MSTKNIILKADNISKQYRLGTVGTGTLSHDLNRWWHSIRGKEDPYLKVGDINVRGTKVKSDYVKLQCFGYNFIFIEEGSDTSNINLNYTSQILTFKTFNTHPSLDFYLKNYNNL